LKYAPVLAVDYERQRWKVVGIIVHNRHGVAIIQLDEEDKVIRDDLTFKSQIASYNEQFEEGGLTFYERESTEMASHLAQLPTSDPEFVAKFRDKLAEGKSNMLAIGEVLEFDSENVLEHAAALLTELKKGNKSEGQQASTRR